MEDLESFLAGLGLEKYLESLRANDVDLDILGTLNEGDLQSLGISLGHRKKLLAVLAQRRGSKPTPSGGAAPEGERRQLTIAFADLVGSTELARRLDPEDYQHLLRSYHAVCSEVVARYEGHVAQFLGDGVLAYFGYPSAHEDDAVRAATAALEIVRRIGLLGAPRGSSALHARVGIATGVTIVGGVAGEIEGQRLAIGGDTPNFAARLQSVAPVDGVVIGDSTRRLLGSEFELADLGLQIIRGFDQPQPAWRVIMRRDSESRFAARSANLRPLIGRKGEVDRLLDRWEKAQQGEGQVVLISAEAGMGKSHLVRELTQHEQTRSRAERLLQCSPYYANTAYYPFVEHLRRAMGIAPSDSDADRLGRLDAFLEREKIEDADARPLIAALMAIPAESTLNYSPSRLRDRTNDLLIGLLSSPLANTTALTILEDIHWADASTLELVSQFADRLATLRALVVLTTRPERQPILEGGANVMRIDLQNLSPADAATLIGNVTSGKLLPAEIIAQIVAKTDGIPLFVEELTKTVLESGLVRELSGSFELTGPLSPLAIPSTLQDSLTARLDRLAPVREIAQIGAAIGREFSRELVREASRIDGADLDDALEQLVASELVAATGPGVFTFKHALIQDAAYEGMLKSTRQQLHSKLAIAIEKLRPQSRETRPELLAHHLTLAGLVAEAVPLWLAAGQNALARSALVETIAHFSKALDLLLALPPSAERDELELIARAALGYANATHRGWGADEVRTAVEPGIRIFDPAKRRTDVHVVPYLLLAPYHLSRAEYDRNVEVNAELRRLGVAWNQPALVKCAEAQEVYTRCWMGQFTVADQAGDALMKHLDLDEDRRQAFQANQEMMSGAMAWHARVLVAMGYPDRAVAKAKHAIAYAKEIGQPFGVMFALNISAFAFFDSGLVEEANGALRESSDLNREQHFVMWDMIWSPLNMAMIHTDTGHPELVDEAQVNRSLDIWASVGGRGLIPQYLALLGETQFLTGRRDEGLATIERSLRMAFDTGEGVQFVKMLGRKARCLAMAEDQVGAEAALIESLRIADHQQARGDGIVNATDLAGHWRARGKSVEALAMIDPLYRWFTEGLDTPALKRAAAMINALKADVAGGSAKNLATA